jgi:hypothetical protein
MAHEYVQVVRDEWVTFPGGELQGKRPKALCPACRATLRREAVERSRRDSPRATRPLCFQCYRADLERERAIAAAAQLDTSSAERFPCQLPLEPVNIGRLSELKIERAEARTVARRGVGACVDRRRRAQIAARHALQAIAAGFRAHDLPSERHRLVVEAIHAAELQLPDAWLPFVVAR